MAAIEECYAELLLALRLGGPLDAARAATHLGTSIDEAVSLLDGLQRAGLVACRDALGGRFILTDGGKRQAGAVIASESRSLEPAIAPHYDAFSSLNHELKELCHRWQVREMGAVEVANDHADARHDASVLRALGRWHESAAGLLEALSRLGPRYERYRSRLDAALERAGRGEIAYVTGLGVDSLHAVWWQLHADLLAMLGRERGQGDA